MRLYNCLVVEDSTMMRQLLTVALSRIKGLNIVEADDGMEGLKRLAEQEFDIVIVDINMPVLDGLKLVKRIRTDDRHCDTPIIIVTTEGSEEDKQRARHLGVDVYLTKPVHSQDVIARVKELLKIDD